MSIGCIHGRFQPFHNGHLEYLLAAHELSDHLIVGVTQYEPQLEDSSSPSHRFDIDENPFSYWERVEIIKKSLIYKEIDLSRISFTPFPIHRPSLIRNYIRMDCIMYTTICDKWNLEKISRLQKEGFEVVVLWERDYKEFEGKNVRRILKSGEGELEKMVPFGAAEIIREFYKGSKNLRNSR